MRSLLLLFSVLPALLFSSKGDVIKGMGEFLNEYNTGASVESAGVYEGQMAGYATAGGLTTRSGVFNRKPITITPPSYSAGCSGIDLHLGSFSYIAKDELISALKNTASSSLSYAFLLGLKSLSPQAEDAMRWLQEQASFFNSMNINSCEIAEQAVSAIYPATQGARQHICRSMATQEGALRDIAMARKNCSASNVDIRKEQKGDAFIGSYNVAWDVIKKDPFLSSHPEFAEFFLSITGTIVIDEDRMPKHYPSMVHDATFMKNLFEGGDVKCYLCTVSKPDIGNIFKSSEGCLSITEGTRNFSGENSFHQIVNESLKQMQTSVAQNKPLDAQYRAILGKTSLPIAGIINAMTSFNRGRSPVELTTFSHVITMDIVCQYLKDVIRNMRSTSLQMRNVQMDSSQIDNFLTSLQDVEKIVLEYEVKGKNVFDEYLRNMQLLEMIENNLRKNIAL